MIPHSPSNRTLAAAVALSLLLGCGSQEDPLSDLRGELKELADSTANSLTAVEAEIGQLNRGQSAITDGLRGVMQHLIALGFPDVEDKPAKALDLAAKAADDGELELVYYHCMQAIAAGADSIDVFDRIVDLAGRLLEADAIEAADWDPVDLSETLHGALASMLPFLDPGDLRQAHSRFGELTTKLGEAAGWGDESAIEPGDELAPPDLQDAFLALARQEDLDPAIRQNALDRARHDFESEHVELLATATEPEVKDELNGGYGTKVAEFDALQSDILFATYRTQVMPEIERLQAEVAQLLERAPSLPGDPEAGDDRLFGSAPEISSLTTSFRELIVRAAGLQDQHDNFVGLAAIQDDPDAAAAGLGTPPLVIVGRLANYYNFHLAIRWADWLEHRRSDEFGERMGDNVWPFVRGLIAADYPDVSAEVQRLQGEVRQYWEKNRLAAHNEKLRNLFCIILLLAIDENLLEPYALTHIDGIWERMNDRLDDEGKLLAAKIRFLKSTNR